MRKPSIALALLIALVVAVPGAAGAWGTDDLIFGPDTHPHGASYHTWAARYGRYLAEPPVSKSPIADPSCRNIGKDHGVLLLPVATAEGIVDRCEIPSDTALLVSPGGTFRILGLDAATRDGVRRLVREDIDAIHDLKVKIDGHRVHHLQRFFTGAWTEIELGNDNLFGAPRGEYQMLIKGWALILRGFRSGRHTIALSDVFADANGDPQVGSITFILTVDDD
jgi:hypothetical protein